MSGKLSGTTTRSCAPAIARIQSSSDDLPSPTTATSRVRPQMFDAVEVDVRGQAARGAPAGSRASVSEPSSPDSSAVTEANRIERRGRSGRAVKASAIASMAATPEALSSAPL